MLVFRCLSFNQMWIILLNLVTMFGRQWHWSATISTTVSIRLRINSANDGMRITRLVRWIFSSRTALIAENLFLRKQLACSWNARSSPVARLLRCA